MSKKPLGNLSAFVASKTDAAPAPLYRELPREAANNDEVQSTPRPAPALKNEPAPKPVKPVVDDMVAFNMRVAKSFRRMLKQYALDLDKDMSEIVREGVELHRQKYGKK